MQKMVKRVSRVMKDSGDERIAFIPNEWGLIKLKYIVDCNKDVLRETTDHNYSFRYVDIGSVSLEKGIEKYERVSFGDSPSRARRIVHKGDVIVSTVRTYLKAIANIDDADNVIVSTGFAVLSPRIVDPLFLEYACKSHYFTENVTIESTGISYPAINSTKLLQLKIAVPSKEEQVIIGQILHDRIKEIDRVIEQTKLTIEDYKLLKQSIITEAVTKGLDKNVEMKDSGIEWIGEIPKQWNILMLTQVFNQVKNKNKDLSEDNLLSLSYGNIIKRSINTTDGLLPESFDGYNIINNGDIVLRLTDLQNDQTSLRVGLSRETGIITSAYVTIRKKINVDERYLYYFLHSFDIYKGFYGMGAGVRQGLNFSGLKKLKLTIPTLEEQQQIINYIEVRTSKIENLKSIKEKLLVDLEEYKKSIIYEYVTGKKEVE